MPIHQAPSMYSHRTCNKSADMNPDNSVALVGYLLRRQVQLLPSIQVKSLICVSSGLLSCSDFVELFLFVAVLVC